MNLKPKTQGTAEPLPLANQDGFLDPKAAAAFLGVSWLTLADWRVKGTGPAYSRAGRLIRYRKSTLEAWLEGRTCTSTSESKGA